MSDLDCYIKLYEYVKDIYRDLDQGIIYDLYDIHNDLKRKIGNVLITIGHKLGMDIERIKIESQFKHLRWEER